MASFDIMWLIAYGENTVLRVSDVLQDLNRYAVVRPLPVGHTVLQDMENGTIMLPRRGFTKKSCTLRETLH